MTANTKTPVMVLQELTVKRGLVPPTYTLLNELTKQGTHKNEFYYQVYAAYNCAMGSGSSKQIARHDAARKLLKLLEIEGIYRPEENPVQDCIPGLSSTVQGAQVKTPLNCIGTLTEMCDENKIPMPQFVEISDVGPPHCRQFTYECIIGSIKTTATASTKKQAKHMAANKMIDKIKDVLPELAAEHNPDAKSIAETEADIIDIFKEISTTFCRPNLSTKIEDYNLVFKKIFEEKEVTYQDIEQYFDVVSEENLTLLSEKLEFQYKFEAIQANGPCIIALSFSTESPFAALGVGQNINKAKQNAIEKAYHLMKILAT